MFNMKLTYFLTASSVWLLQSKNLTEFLRATKKGKKIKAERILKHRIVLVGKVQPLTWHCQVTTKPWLSAHLHGLKIPPGMWTPPLA